MAGWKKIVRTICVIAALTVGFATGFEQQKRAGARYLAGARARIKVNAVDLPLFRAFPSLADKITRVKILDWPTKLKSLSRLEDALYEEQGLSAPERPRLWVKRDDVSDSLYGGNKARKLEFLIADAIESGATTLVTSGMYGSNHALATAAVARAFGFKSTLILGPQPVTPDVRRKLLTFRALGAEMRFHSGKVGMGIDIEKYAMLGAWPRLTGIYNIPPGGSNELSGLGYANAFFELVEQTGMDGLPERIVVPAGSLGTAAGLLVGSCLAGAWERVRIDAVQVADPMFTNEMALRAQAQDVYDFIRGKLSKADRAKLPKCDFGRSGRALKFTTAYYEPGYGAATPQVHDAIKLVKDVEYITVEITYSGKAMTYFLDEARRAIKERGTTPRTLFWLTYDSYDLEKVIETRQWSHPEMKWLDLPKDFWPLFKD
jgi:1-aminocyclopropane-1-carboxylate deaminase/D-cysteine desulfhydrase-like pyridoxal-dependent ACC family enzyme